MIKSDKRPVNSIIFLLLVCLVTYPILKPSGALGSDEPTGHFHDDFIIIRSGPDDTLSSLANKYLHNSKLGWIIAKFNDIETVTPGQDIIIPLKPFQWGGLSKTGYQTVPVLVYHRFSGNKAEQFVITESAFNEQMAYLNENNFTVITLDNLLDFLNFKIQLPKKSVVVTLDGGWKSQYTIAYPILKKYNFHASFFIRTDFIDKKDALSWGQIRKLLKEGYDIQSQTNSNRNLVELKEGATFKEYLKSLEDEILIPQKIFKVKLRRKCTFLAYPIGETNNLVIELLKKYGYRGGFTLNRGSNPFFINDYMINRSIIFGDFSLAQFKENLSVFTERALK